MKYIGNIILEVSEYFCPLSVDGLSLCMATVNFNFLRDLWEICAQCPPSELLQPGTQHHRVMLKEHLYKILTCPCNQRQQFKRQRE